jgi:hypothetical protein
MSDAQSTQPESQQTTAYVYFVQAATTGLIKIGCTGNVKKRLLELQAMNSEVLTLLGCRPGSLEEEAFLHERFADLRRHGEWFKPATELLAFIRENAFVPTGPASPAASPASASLGPTGGSTAKPSRKKKREDPPPPSPEIFAEVEAAARSMGRVCGAGELRLRAALLAAARRIPEGPVRDCMEAMALRGEYSGG